MSEKAEIIDCAECGADILNNFELLEGLKKETHIIVPKEKIETCIFELEQIIGEGYQDHSIITGITKKLKAMIKE